MQPTSPRRTMWIKNVIVELAITVIIALAAFGDVSWARWIVLIYTPFILFLKLLAVFGSGLLKSMSRGDDPVPTWFWHANYAVNVALLLAGQLWMLAGAWALIWVLSAVYQRRVNAPVAAPKTARKAAR